MKQIVLVVPNINVNIIELTHIYNFFQSKPSFQIVLTCWNGNETTPDLVSLVEYGGAFDENVATFPPDLLKNLTKLESIETADVILVVGGSGWFHGYRNLAPMITFIESKNCLVGATSQGVLPLLYHSDKKFTFACPNPIEENMFMWKTGTILRPKTSRMERCEPFQPLLVEHRNVLTIPNFAACSALCDRIMEIVQSSEEQSPPDESRPRPSTRKKRKTSKKGK